MLDRVEEVEDAKPRGFELGDEERDGTRLEPVKRLGAVSRRRRGVSLAPQQLAQGFSRSVLVIDDENMTT
jgi:hypothetical protein